MKQWIVLGCLLLAACNGSDDHVYQGYVEGENIYLASPYSGVLTEKNYNRGQTVKKGETLFQLDENPQQLVLKQREANLKQAQKQLADLKKPKRPSEIKAIEAQISQTESQLQLAALRVKRFQKLRKQQASDQDTVDAAIARFDELGQLKKQYQANLALAKQGARDEQIKAQQAKVESLVEAVKQSQWQLAQKTINAPNDGVLFDVFYRQGEFVPNQQPIAALLAPENIRIEFFVPVRALATLALGKTLYFDCAGCAADNKAVISYISPEAEYVPPLVYSEKNYSKLVYRIKAKMVNAVQFKPGQPVIVRAIPA